MAIILIVVGFVICVGGIYFFQMSFFYYNKYNIHAKKAVLDRLYYKYNQEFNLISTEFDRKETTTGGARYVNVWTFVFKDNSERQFYAYLWIYGMVGKGDGNYNATDYYTYIADTYGQLRIEEDLENEFDLNKYRQQKDAKAPNQEDYIFVCTNNNAAEIAEMLTKIYFKERELSKEGCLNCIVNNEEGKKMFSYRWREITKELQDENKEITEETVCNYILQKLQ